MAREETPGSGHHPVRPGKPLTERGEGMAGTMGNTSIHSAGTTGNTSIHTAGDSVNADRPSHQKAAPQSAESASSVQASGPRSAAPWPAIEADLPFRIPPRWASLQRELLAAMDEAVELVMDRYVRPDGSLMWPASPDHEGVDALDDAYESFHNWPLQYVLGGGDKLKDYALRQFDAITKQFSRIPTGYGHPMVVDDYEQGYDWFHQGEGYLFFYFLGLAAPEHEANRKRALSFAGYYMEPDIGDDGGQVKEDLGLEQVQVEEQAENQTQGRIQEQAENQTQERIQEQAENQTQERVQEQALNQGKVKLLERNYDPALRLVRSPHVGSMGPGWRNFDGLSWPYADWKRYYGLPYQDVPGIGKLEDVRNPEAARRMGEAIANRVSRGDSATNLAITSLMAHAYMWSGDERYKAWALGYTDAWMARAEANGGIVPDNVGLSGQVGEHMGGKWYGGYYGWTWPHGWHSLGSSVALAAENAALLSGNRDYLHFLRSQLDELASRGIMHEGTLHVPYKHGDPGWYSYDLWIDGVLHEDGTASIPYEHAGKPLLWRDGWFEFQPMEGHFPVHLWCMSMREDDLSLARTLRNERSGEWRRVGPGARFKKDRGGHDQAWLAYLQGEYPDYPEEMLTHQLGLVYGVAHGMRNDAEDPANYKETYLQKRNPVVTEGLLQLTLGAPRPIYNGGLLQARVRYYDAERRRPGLPQDVAALVEQLREDSATVQLVNLSLTETRTVVLQAGGYGEHRFESVSYEVAANTGDAAAAAENFFYPANLHAEPLTTQRRLDVGSVWFQVRLQPGCRIRLELEMTLYAGAPTYRGPFDI